MDQIACQLRCVGKVQGVFYRKSTQETAVSLGLTGWVKNENNGDVLIHAEGKSAAVEALRKWCSTGPPLAMVKEVITEPAEVEEFKSFEVRYF